MKIENARRDACWQKEIVPMSDDVIKILLRKTPLSYRNQWYEYKEKGRLVCYSKTNRRGGHSSYTWELYESGSVMLTKYADTDNETTFQCFKIS